MYFLCYYNDCEKKCLLIDGSVHWRFDEIKDRLGGWECYSLICYQ